MSWKDGEVFHMRHYYLFKKQELLTLIKKSGFKILEFYKPQTNLGLSGLEKDDKFSKKNWILRVKKQ